MSRRDLQEHVQRGRSTAQLDAAVPGRGTLPEQHALPDPVRAKMEQSFGADFSGVRIHEGSKANDVGARAFAQGTDIHFAPGEFRPGTQEGDELIGHELAHIVQQREGRVAAPQGKGMPVNADDGLEHEADIAGAAAARGERAGVTSSSTAGVGSSAPMQLKKKKFEKGTELTEHKPGTKEAKKDYLELMDGDDGTRAGKIAALFDQRVKKSANQRFYHLQMWLMGNNAGLETAYLAKTQRPLRDDLATLSPAQYKYCISCLDHGVPMLEDKIRLALGMLTGAAADQKEVLLLMIGDSDHEVTDDDKLRAWNNLKGELSQKLKSDKFAQLETHIESVQLGRRHALENGPISLNQHEQMLEQKDREITALARAQKGSLSMKRDKLGEVLPPWAAKHDETTRHYVTRRQSMFSTMLHNEIVKLPFGKQIMFTQADVDYALAIVRDGGAVDDKFFQDGETTKDQPTDKAREKREDNKKEEGAKHGEFVAYFERKEQNGADKKWQWGTLKEKVEEMSQEQRDWFLREQLDPADQQLWDDEDQPAAIHNVLRLKGIGEIERRLHDMGMKGDGILNSGGDSTRKKILEAFRYGASDNITAGGSTIQRILKFSKEKMDAAKYGKKAVALLRKLRGDEYAHIRAHTEIMTNLQSKASPKYWDRIQAMLGVGTVGTHDGAKGTVDGDVLNVTESTWLKHGAKVDQQKYDLEEARDLGAREAELMPSHWGLVLTAALKEARVLRRTEINSLVNRAYTAGKEREQLTKNGDLKLSGDRKLTPMTASDFVIATYESITAGGKKVLESHKNSKLAHAYEALTTGTRVSVDDVLEDAHYATLSLKHTSGFHASLEGITQSFEDIDGKDLLEEWSNIAELRELKKTGDQDKVRDFVIDVREDRMKQLEKDVPRAELIKTLSKLRKKLANAAATDQEVVGMLRELGYDNDEYSQARTKNLGLLDEQRLRSTGAQYNTFLGGKTQIKAVGKTFIGSSSSSAQVKESTGTLLGHTRKAQHDLRGGVDRETVVDTHGKNIKDSQEELERRGEAFDKMRKGYNKIVEYLTKALVAVVAAAALAAVTLATGGVGGAIGVAMIAGKALMTSLVMAGVKKALQGDSFNTEKAIWDVAFKTIINGGFAAVGAFGVPELLGALGETATTVGDGVSSTSEFALPQDAGHAAWRMALEHGLTKGAKGIFREAVRAARDTDTNPAHRAMILLHLGSVVTQLGAKVGSAAYAEYNEDLQSSSTNAMEKKSSDSFNKGLAKTPKLAKVGFMALEMKLAPEDTIKGKDRGNDAELFIQNAIDAGEVELQSLLKADAEARKHGTDNSGIQARYLDVDGRVQALKDLLEQYKKKLKDKGKQDTLDKVKNDNTKVVEGAFALIEFLNKPDPRVQTQHATV